MHDQLGNSTTIRTNFASVAAEFLFLSRMSGMSIALKSLSPSEVIAISRQHPVLAFGAAVGFLLFLATRYLESPWRKLPPGPRDLPFLGSALELRS